MFTWWAFCVGRTECDAEVLGRVWARESDLHAGALRVRLFQGKGTWFGSWRRRIELTASMDCRGQSATQKCPSTVGTSSRTAERRSPSAKWTPRINADGRACLPEWAYPCRHCTYTCLIERWLTVAAQRQIIDSIAGAHGGIMCSGHSERRCVGHRFRRIAGGRLGGGMQERRLGRAEMEG